ncbi:hypothetical protein RND81_03G225000 [Saponaria officinalis]|uniref:Rho-GAP domain-containing protein n=1 Tax=Saponaria officinalis TaxID=3572 RepID=A0AAW1M251_SAPOF
MLNKSREKNENRESGEIMGVIIDYMVETLRKSLLVTYLTSTLEISCPTHVRHISHVTFDCFHGFLVCLMNFFLNFLLNVSVFGVSPQSMQCCIDERGSSVPTLLIMMQKQVYAQGGLLAEGIFRINAENSHEECVRSELNRGVVPRDIDVHCLAGLIKAWFRELPKGVLDCLTPEEIWVPIVMHCNTEDECTQLVKLLPPTETNLLDWTINLMADVVQNEHYNKMNARNIALMADPLTVLIHAVQVMNLLKTLIERTLRLREESSETTTTLSANSVLSHNSHNQRSSTSFGELIMYKQNNCSAFEQPHSNKQTKYSDEGKVTYEGGEADGIFDKLNFRKGVKKLCRHTVFQLSKPTRKIAEVGFVHSS